MDDAETQTLYQSVTDRVDRLRSQVLQELPPVPPPSHDAQLALAPGALQLDTVTGEVVEILSGQRTHSEV